MFLERFLLFLRRLFASKDVHYINGPDILPPPLSPDEEAELLRGYDGIDPAVKEILITRNLRLVVFIAKKYEAPGTGLEDIISIGSIGLIKAVNTFCPSKNIKLATYASRCIENEILMYLRKYSSLKNEVSIDEPLNFDPDGNELLLSDVLGTESDEITVGVEAEDEKKTLLNLVSELSLREREIMYMRFGIAGHEELTQKEVADKLGISQSYISRLEKRILKKLKVEFEALA